MRLGAVLVLASLGWTQVGDGASQGPTVGDPSVQEPALAAQTPLAQPLAITEELMVIRDSVEAVLVAQDTIIGPQRQIQISVVRGWLARSSELQQELIEILPSLSVSAAGGSPGSGGDPDASTQEVQDGLELIQSRVVEYTRWLQAAYRDQRDRETAAMERLSAARAEAAPE